MDSTTPPAAVPPPAAPLPPPAQSRGSDKIWCILSHLSWFIGVPFLLPLVVFLAMRGESNYVAENAKEALNFHISIIIYGLCCIPLVFVIVGAPLLIAIALSSLVLAIVAAVKCADGVVYRYPLTLRLVR
jgi:uncharacterized protein